MEKNDETKGFGNEYTTDYRQSDPRLGRWTSMDPIIKYFESPYASYSNNPIYFIDPSGLDPTEGEGNGGDNGNSSKSSGTTPSKLTGSKNLIVYITDGHPVNEQIMKGLSKKFDYVIAGSLSEAKDILQKEYGNKKGFVSNLVLRTHGTATTEDNKLVSGMTVGGSIIKDPAKSEHRESLAYFKDITTNDANIMITACAGCSVEATGTAFATFFVKNSKRSLFMNYTSTNARKYDDKNKNKDQDFDENEWFNFDNWTVKHPSVSGFKRWSYSPILKNITSDKVFYDIKVKAATGTFELKKLEIPFKVDDKIVKPFNSGS
jgi:RHS repeat-associated protein